MVEQQQIEDSGDSSTECYNSLFDHLSVRRRVLLMGEHLYNAHDQETEIVVTEDLIEILGPALYERYMNCVRSQSDFDSSHDSVLSLREQYGDNESIRIKIIDTRAIIKNYDDREQQVTQTLRALEEGFETCGE